MIVERNNGIHGAWTAIMDHHGGIKQKNGRKTTHSILWEYAVVDKFQISSPYKHDYFWGILSPYKLLNLPWPNSRFFKCKMMNSWKPVRQDVEIWTEDYRKRTPGCIKEQSYIAVSVCLHNAKCPLQGIFISLCIE